MELAHRLVSSKTATATLAVLAALAAGLTVLVYVNHYRSSVEAGGTPATVLVAKQAIPKGMTLGTALSGGYVKTETVRTDELTSGAVTDPTTIKNDVATQDVLPGEQITTTLFGASVGGLATHLAASARAVAVSVDTTHGVAGQIQQGDRVDVLVGFNSQDAGTGVTQPVVKMLLENVPVLMVSHSGSGLAGQAGGSVVLEVNSLHAAQLAYAAANGQIWLVLRPRVGAPFVKPSLVTLQSLLGTAPIVTGRA